MRIRYELSNYRCFPDESPARLVIRPGFTSLVGINNAGKSTVLRSLFEFRRLFTELSSIGSGRYQNQSNEIQIMGPSDPREVFTDANSRSLRLTVGLAAVSGPSELPVPEEIRLTVARENRASEVELKVSGQTFTPGGWVSHGGSSVLSIGSGMVEMGPYAEAFRLLADSVYVGAFRNALNVGAGEPYYDLSVGQAFIEQWDDFKVGSVKSNRHAALHVERELARIFDLPNLQLNASQDSKTLLVTIGDETYALNDLGAGLAQFIIVLAFSATREPALILIDEPELNLHPALQLDFLNTLGSFASSGVLFATHSIGLARAGSEAIYSVRRIEQGRSEIRPLEATPAMSEFLGELSLSGYQELGFSSVLLVEGPSELRAVQGLLRHYDLEHKVVLLPLGGGSMIRGGVGEPLQEVTRLADRVFALIDSERVSADADLPEDRQGFASACRDAGIRCHVLERRAFENYFTDAAVKAALGDRFSALGPYELLKESAEPWSKPKDNWRIATEMKKADLDATDLGRFLTEIQEVVEGSSALTGVDSEAGR